MTPGWIQAGGRLPRVGLPYPVPSVDPAARDPEVGPAVPLS
jgi:hypothetical protein